MKRLPVIIVLTWAATLLVHAQSISDSFSFEEGTYSGTTLPYRKAVIGVSETQKPALVLYLHGGSSKGSNNTAQMNERGIDSIYHYLQQAHETALFLVPQCPSTASWGGRMNVVLKGLIDQYVSNGEVDKNRIYIFGGSMGGTGTLNFVSAYPGLFSAVMAVAANPSQCKIENVAQSPFYTVMGGADTIMSMETMQTFVNQLTTLQSDVKMDIEDGWTHEITCIQSYTTARLTWVFSHTKGNDAHITTAGDTCPVSAIVAIYGLDGTRHFTLAPGINVVKTSQGETKKILIRP